MALFDASRPVVSSHGLGARFYTLFAGFVATVVAWNDARVTRNELRKLSDHELDDLGLTRGDVEMLFRK